MLRRSSNPIFVATLVAPFGERFSDLDGRAEATKLAMLFPALIRVRLASPGTDLLHVFYTRLTNEWAGLSPIMRMKTLSSRNPITGTLALGQAFGAGQPLARLGNTLKLICSAALLACALLEARASDPVGIYTFVDKVVYEPSTGAPERIQVWGGFALAKGGGERYEQAERGYMYFKLRQGEEEVCRKEWADLKSVAGTGQIVAFGARYGKNGTVRKPDAKAENADEHPKGWGLTKIKTHDYGPLNQLVALMDKKPASKSAPKPAPGPEPVPAPKSSKAPPKS